MTEAGVLQTRYLGAARLAVPSVGLGCMALAGLYGTPEESASLQLLDRALELGCTFLDTSDAYGPFTNEELLGRALAGRRDRVVHSRHAAASARSRECRSAACATRG